MPTSIRQFDDDERSRTVLRIDGEMYLEDAELLRKIVREIAAERSTAVVVDLADLDLIDGDAASELLKLEAEDLIELSGIDEFVQSSIDRAEGRSIHLT
jgi:anti-anti-sigma regulatory factor